MKLKIIIISISLYYLLLIFLMVSKMLKFKYEVILRNASIQKVGREILTIFLEDAAECFLQYFFIDKYLTEIQWLTIINSVVMALISLLAAISFVAWIYAYQKIAYHEPDISSFAKFAYSLIRVRKNKKSSFIKKLFYTYM